MGPAVLYGRVADGLITSLHLDSLGAADAARLAWALAAIGRRWRLVLADWKEDRVVPLERAEVIRGVIEAD